MALFRPVRTALALGALVLAAAGAAAAQSKDLGNGFRDHGVAVPISNQRGTAATVDGAGRNVLIVLLMDHRGGYSLLEIDAQTGKAEQFPMPFTPPGESVDSPYSAMLSSGNKFYTHFNSRLVEFDPVKRAYTFCQKTTPWFAMGMTEDDRGLIWTVTYPQSGVLSFDPKTRELKDYGEIYKQPWAEYPNSIAADDKGFIYFGLGYTASQIVMFDPKTGTGTPVLAEIERKNGVAYVYRDLDGKVYGQPLKGGAGDWIEFYQGKARRIGAHDASRPKPIATGNRLTHNTFPDGTKAEVDTIERVLVVTDPRTGGVKKLPFDYETDGAIVMGEAAGPGGVIIGGSSFPMNEFTFDPRTNAMTNRPAFGQWNIVLRDADRIYVGAYSGGHLLEWRPGKPWVDTDPKKVGQGNPTYLGTAEPDIIRPSQLLMVDGGKTVIMSGTPAYGRTGGGLLFYDRVKAAPTVLKDADVVPDQSTLSMIALPGGKMLAGTTTAAGTGGEKKANEAVLYVMDLASKKVEWKGAPLPGVQDYTQLVPGPKGLVYGLADRKVFFVFDPAKREIVSRQDAPAELGMAAHHQGPRVFVAGPRGEIYLIFQKGIGRVDAKSNAVKTVAISPIQIDTGGDYLGGRLYFSSGSHLLSYPVGGTAR